MTSIGHTRTQHFTFYAIVYAELTMRRN